MPKKTYTPQEKAALLEQYEKAESKEQFCKTHGMSKATPIRWLATVRLAEVAAKKKQQAKKNGVNGHTEELTNFYSAFRVFVAIERELSKVPASERLEIINTVRARLTGERAT